MLSFGSTLREARKAKGYTLRGLAELAKVDFTYLSKLENEKADYPPSEELLRWLAQFFELDTDRLIYLSGRIPREKLDLLGNLAKRYPDEVAKLFCQIKNDPNFGISGSTK